MCSNILAPQVEAFCASVRRSLEEPSFEVKQKVLQLVVDRIVVEESRVVIQHVVPTGAVRLQTEQHPPEKVYFGNPSRKGTRGGFCICLMYHDL
jgi:hypothetical protein